MCEGTVCVDETSTDTHDQHRDVGSIMTSRDVGSIMTSRDVGSIIKSRDVGSIIKSRDVGSTELLPVGYSR